MSHQGEDGWYPECKICNCGNLSDVVCLDCHKEALKDQKDITISRAIDEALKHRWANKEELTKLIKAKLT